MAIDSTIAVRKGMLKLVKTASSVTAIVPKGRIYTQWTLPLPAYPFIRSGPPSSIPIKASCVDGQEITVAWHAFASGEDAEIQAASIGAALAASLDGSTFVIPNGKARVQWTGSQLLMDPQERSVFHAIVNFRVRCITG